MLLKEMGKILEQEFLQTVEAKCSAVSPIVTLDPVGFYQGNEDRKLFC